MSSPFVPRYTYQPEVMRRASEEAARRESTLSTSSVKSVAKSLARRYKEHNASVQAAYENFYGINQTPRRASDDSVSSIESQGAARRPSAAGKAWSAVKQHAREHHASVNNAYAAYYGDERVHRQRAEAIQQFDVPRKA